MQIYLIRHGIAVDRGTYDDDEQRPLTAKGRSKTSKVADALLAKGIEFDLILSSPLVRAYQTAEILHQANLSQQIVTFEALKPNGDIEEFISWLQEQDREQTSTVALVGHQPDLGNWAEILIWGTIKGQIIVKKAGVIGLELPEIGSPISRSTLFLSTSPKWMI